MPQTQSGNGMIATPHHVATEIGASVLREGGSAIDAAIAANAALTVLLPDQTSIGGDCFMIIWPHDESAPMGLNGSGRAPAAADPDALRAQGYQAMPRFGAASVTVPGTIDAWFTAHERFGTLPMNWLLEPAVTLARDGFPVSIRLANAMNVSVTHLASFPVAASIFLEEGRAPAPGYMLANPALANSLDAIGREGRDAFYRGWIADQIVATAGGDNGWMTGTDLATHASSWDDPISLRYRNATLWELPPNSQGVTALLALAMMDREAVGASWDDPAWLHVQIEAKKRAFAIRDRFLADPEAMTITVDDVLNVAAIDGMWSDFDPWAATVGQPTLPGDTIFLGVIDGDGLAVSLIQSIYQAFGSGLVAGDTGIVLQNRGSYFSLNPGHPNELVGGKRPLHTLMPGMIDIDGDRRGPIGTQGGDAQAQIHIQLASHLIDFGMTPQEALALPRWFSGDGRSGDPFAVVIEAGMPHAAASGLIERGHAVNRVEPGWPNAGYAQIVLRNRDSGEITGAADPRAEGSAERG
ncbi:MAG: gamma-glutamyltransferase family protein [Chloroflexota bacterium]|nr:gamma-glutamyltransferase family protein [Chloroflexota bacterium]